jgi:DNA-binding NarL/FixJ family response regulator
MIRVVIADDHNLVRQGICALLGNEDDIRVIGEARDGLEAVSMVENLNPDVLILDINMPQLDGIETMKRVIQLGSDTRVIILSMYSDESLIKKALINGARGYLLKRSVTEDLLSAVRSASRREIFISPDIADKADIDWITAQPEDDPLEQLTSRERQIFKLVAEGNTNSAIATELGISVKTVEKHRASLMEKLGVSDVTGLVRQAIQLGLIFLEG